MALLLNIDTALDIASVCLSKDGSVLQKVLRMISKKIMRCGCTSVWQIFYSQMDLPATISELLQ